MKGLRKSLAVMAAAALMLTLVPAVALAGEDSLTGTFGVNDPPTIDYVKLYDTEASPSETTSMTPQVKFDARVKVSDADGLTDLTTIVVKIYFDGTAGTDETEFNGIATGNAQNQIIITWTQGETFVLTEETDSSWDMVVGDCVEPGTLADEFQFQFTVGKVATEATGVDGDRWQVAAKVTDDATQTDWDADSEGASMAWYGEVSVGPSSVDFGTLAKGTDFLSANQSVSLVTYIANGDYDEKVRTTSPWTGASYNATLDDTGTCGSANEFALKADDTGTYGDAEVVDITGVIIDNNTDGQTTEDGDAVTTNNLWLKLAATFDADNYSGSIYFIIA